MTEEPDIFDTSTADDQTDAAIEAALREMNRPTYRVDNVRKYPEHNRHVIVWARVIQRHYPERMEDPDLAIVREMWAQEASERAGQARAQDEATELLAEARRQLEYLDGRFPTGTTPAVLARITAALAAGGL